MCDGRSLAAITNSSSTPATGPLGHSRPPGAYSIPSSSTSKTRVLFGGILGEGLFGP